MRDDKVSVVNKLIVTSLQNDKMIFFYDEHKFTPSHLKTCMSFLSGIPKECISFYNINEQQNLPIEQHNITAIFTAEEDHVLLRIKLNYILSQGKNYNSSYYLHVSANTAIDSLITQINRTVIKKFEIDEFCIMINRKKIFDINPYAPDIDRSNTIKEILNGNENKIIDVVIKEPYVTPVAR